MTDVGHIYAQTWPPIPDPNSKNYLVLDSDNVEVSNNLIVLNDASFNSDVDISGLLTVQGDISCNSNVDISGDLIVRGDVVTDVIGIVASAENDQQNNVDVYNDIINITEQPDYMTAKGVTLASNEFTINIPGVYRITCNFTCLLNSREFRLTCMHKISSGTYATIAEYRSVQAHNNTNVIGTLNAGINVVYTMVANDKIKFQTFSNDIYPAFQIGQHANLISIIKI